MVINYMLLVFKKSMKDISYFFILSNKTNKKVFKIS